MAFKLVALCALVTLLVFAAHVDAQGRRGLKDSQAAAFAEEPHRARLAVRFLADTGTEATIPEPEVDVTARNNPFVKLLKQKVQEALAVEAIIQDCINTEECGTPP